MANRAGERVGRIGRRLARQSKKSPHHVLHLLLGSVPVAHDRLLHLQRGVLGDRQAGDHRGADRGAPRLAERERRLRVHVHEHFLDRHLEQRVGRDHLFQAVEDRLKPRREIALPRFHATARHVDQPAGARLDHAEARESEARIDAQNPQSITAVV